MAKNPILGEAPGNGYDQGIHTISVQGFKSIAQEGTIEIRPLTILAGANSSGKSSIMQPLLLMKQTLEAGYDPGSLLLNGPNARFTSVDQFISRPQRDGCTFSVAIETPRGVRHKITFAVARDQTIQVQEMITAVTDKRTLHLTPGQGTKDLERSLAMFFPGKRGTQYQTPDGFRLAVIQDRCFLSIAFQLIDDTDDYIPVPPGYSLFPLPYMIPLLELRRLIHLPGHRGNPERVYDKTATAPLLTGTFDKYVATIVADWQKTADPRLKRLETMLADLGLTREISARRVNDAQIELLVGRLPELNSEGADLVSIADVGFGVSQVLPVLVALLVAQKDQLVYIEQPELHLHPKAQYRLARILAATAKRGGRLVVETHSALLLLQLRTLMAKGYLDPDLVKLHWFLRHPEDGMASIHSADLDENGAFGDWPEDFGDIELMAEGAYLDAVEERSGENGKTTPAPSGN